MLYANDCAHLDAKDWSKIAAKIIKLKKGEKLLFAISDEHSGGVTSCMPEMKPVIDGFASQADIWLMNGDNFEYESPTAFMQAMEELKQRQPFLTGKALKEKLLLLAETVLHQKVSEDIATLTTQIQENPDRKIVKVIGNHENFATFRKELKKLEKQFPNFQWVAETAIIPIPGDTKEPRDRLLATHGDLQMDDLWFVEDGGTDKERKCLTHSEMAAKVVKIATKPFAASAQKQEKGQGFVNWWRKPNATAKTVYAELLFRAQEGDFHQAKDKADINADALCSTLEILNSRKDKFRTMRKELDEKPEISDTQKKEETKIYTRALESIEEQIKRVASRLEQIEEASNKLFHHTITTPKTILHYKKLGDNEPQILTSKKLDRVTHINYGHTHVSAEAAIINSQNKTPITVSNNASVTRAIMQQPIYSMGNLSKLLSTQPPQTDIGNLGMLLYRTKDGKITEITTIGRLISENIHVVNELIRKPATPLLEKPPQGSPNRLPDRWQK